MNDQTHITSQVRHHAGQVATRVRVMRHVLDTKLAGKQGYDAALTNLTVGVEQLESLAADIGRGGVSAKNLRARRYQQSKKKK